MSSSVISWTTLLKNIESAGILNETIKNEVDAIAKGTTYDEIAQSYEGLFQTESDSRFADLLQDSNAGALSFIKKVEGDVDTYTKSVTLQVKDLIHPDQYTDLYRGSVTATSKDPGSSFLKESLKDGKTPANLYEMLHAELGDTLVTYECKFPGKNPSNPYSRDSHIDVESGWVKSRHDYFEAAQASLADWSPYLHLDTKDANVSVLKRDLLV